LILMSITTFSYADKLDPTDYKPNDFNQNDLQSIKSTVELAGKIISALTVVGTVIAVIVVMVIGIKYIIGSSEEKAEYKKTMGPVLIGMLMLFGSVWIVKFIFDIVSGLKA